MVVQTAALGDAAFEGANITLRKSDGEEAQLTCDVSSVRGAGGSVDKVVVDGTRSMILGLDLDGKVFQTSSSAQFQLCGECSLDSLLEKSLEDFAASPEAAAALSKAVEQALDGKSVVLEATALQTLDGWYQRNVTGLVHPMLDASGKVCGVVAELRDLSERLFDAKVADRLLTSHVLPAAWAVDTAGQVMTSNDMASSLLCDQLEGGLAVSLADFVLPEHMPTVMDAVIKAGQGHQVLCEVEMTTDRESGKTIKLQLDVQPKWDDAGKIESILVATSMPAAVTTDEDGIVIDCNQQAADFLGVAPELMVGQEVMEVFGEESRAQVFDSIQTAMTNSSVHSTMRKCRVLQYQPDGRNLEISAMLDASPQELDDGETGTMVLLDNASRAERQERRKQRRMRDRERKEDGHGTKMTLKHAEKGDRDFHKFQVENVKLKKTKMGGALAKTKSMRHDTGTGELDHNVQLKKTKLGGALGNNTREQEPRSPSSGGGGGGGHMWQREGLKKQVMRGALAGGEEEDVRLSQESEQACVKAFNQIFDLGAQRRAGNIEPEDLKQYLIKTPVDDRPLPLRNVNPWRRKKLEALFDDLDHNGDGFVRLQEFESWYNRINTHHGH